MKFSDGTAFNAEAVCYNMDRMYNQKGAGQTAAQYWGYFFGSFSDKPEGSLYKSCEAKDASTAVINITRSTSSFPTILSLDSFSMQSPTALKAGDANNVVAQGEGFKYPAYAAAPVGVGPYKLDKYDEANKTVTLVANDEYFGEKPKTRQDRLQDHPRREHPPPGAQGRLDRRLRPAQPGGLEGPEGRRQQRRRAPRVQHPLHGPERGARTPS